jgi:hypothetical protein
MHNSLAEAISYMRDEIGLERFHMGDKVICNLYLTEDIQFEATVCSIKASASRRKVYLVNCPASYGYHHYALPDITPDNAKDLNDYLYYRWTEENTLKLVCQTHE